MFAQKTHPFNDRGLLMNARRLIFLIFVFCCAVAIPSCVWDRYVGKRPIDQPGTKWVSTEPYIWFEVADPADRYCYGEIEMDGELVKMEIFFAYDKRAWCNTSKKAKTMIFGGECEFGKDKLTVFLSKDELADQHPEYRLDESIETLTFYRED